MDAKILEQLEIYEEKRKSLEKQRNVLLSVSNNMYDELMTAIEIQIGDVLSDSWCLLKKHRKRLLFYGVNETDELIEEIDAKINEVENAFFNPKNTLLTFVITLINLKSSMI